MGGMVIVTPGSNESPACPVGHSLICRLDLRPLAAAFRCGFTRPWVEVLARQRSSAAGRGALPLGGVKTAAAAVVIQ